LRDIFIEKATKEEKIKFKNILDSVDLGRNENIVLVYAAVKSEEVGFPEPLPIAYLDDYESFLSKKFLERNIKTTKMKNRLCYASGEFKDDVTGLDLSARYSLNKMFVTETKNYASLFDKKSFPLNYQVSLEYQEQLDLASEYLLSNYKTAIADVDHVIIPQFIHEENLDIGLMLNKLKAKSDLLFSFQALDELSKDIGIEADEIYWINFLAFESDGNYFKTLELIKDVSNFHFQDVIKTFNEIDWEFKKLSNIVNWEAAKKNYGKIGKFNLNTVYGLIPIRKDKEKKNIALQLFKTILEQRKIEREQLFQFFSELMLCHYYERYESYTNVRQYGKDYFGLAIRDNVFKYLAFIQVLKKLNLIDMEQERKTVPAKEGVNNFDQKIDAFFKRMDFNDRQKAMFFLGRMLNAVAYLQKEKKKTVIDKINYNGMDRDDIVRLRVDLFEKAKQYGKSEKVKFTDSHFGQYFNFERWIMNPQEAVFFILTGYSFGIVKQQNSNSKND
jgi:CRISPR-associated protein Csh1